MNDQLEIKQMSPSEAKSASPLFDFMRLGNLVALVVVVFSLVSIIIEKLIPPLGQILAGSKLFADISIASF